MKTVDACVEVIYRYRVEVPDEVIEKAEVDNSEVVAYCDNLDPIGNTIINILSNNLNYFDYETRFLWIEDDETGHFYYED